MNGFTHLQEGITRTIRASGMVASSAPDVSHRVWKARRVSSTGLTYPAMRDLTILPIHKRMN